MLQCPLFSFALLSTSVRAERYWRCARRPRSPHSPARLECRPFPRKTPRSLPLAPAACHGFTRAKFETRGDRKSQRTAACPPSPPPPGHREDRPWEGEGLPLRGVRQDHHAGGGRGSRTPIPLHSTCSVRPLFGNYKATSPPPQNKGLLWEGMRTFAQYWAEPQLFPVRAPAGASVGRCGTVSSTDPRSYRYRGQHRTF